MVTVALLLTEKIGEAWLPLIASTFAPGPLKVRLPVISITPLVRRIVPLRPVWKTIVSLPGAALALRIAWRNDPRLLLLRLVTVKVAAPAGMLHIVIQINNIDEIGGNYERDIVTPSL